MSVHFGDRYEQATPIGRGAAGIVYRVFDRTLGCYVALKTLALEGGDDAELKREFRALASVNSPNVVLFHELEVHDDRAFFTMELVDGLDLSTYLDPDAPEALRVSRLVTILPAIIEGVHAVHRAGVLHGDLKPANIMVRVDGSVKLVDFGLSRGASQIDATTGPGVQGTPSFMAPELARGEPPTALCDWYSLGATLYLALTGRPAFNHLELFERRFPPRLDALVPTAPVWLAQLIEDLLDPDPTSRSVPRGVESSTPTVDRASPLWHESWPFIGRHDITARLEAELVNAREQRTRTVILEGPSGIGKSFLLEEFSRLAEHSYGARVLFGQCHAAESVAYRALDRILDALATLVAKSPPAELSALAPPDLAELVTVFPAFSRVTAWGAPERSTTRTASEIQRRAFDSLATLMARVGAVVLIIDDAQWCDRDSLRFLTTLTSRSTTPGILVVLGLRSEPLYESTAKEIARKLGRHHGAVIEVPPWDRDDIRSLLAAMGGAALDDADTELVCEVSGGLPLLARDLATHALTGSVPTSWEVLIQARLDALPHAERTAIDIASVADHPMALSDLVSLTSEDAPDAINAVRRLLASRLLSPSPDSPPRVQLYHHRVAEAARTFIATPRRAALHARIAHTLTHRLDVDPALIARHLEGAGVTDPIEVRRLLLASAERARAKLAFDQAGRLFLAALETDPARGLALLVQTADALALAGRSEHAARLYEEIALCADDALLAARARRDAADQWLRSGDSVRGERLLKTVLADRGLGFPGSMFAALMIVLWGRIKVNVRGTPFSPDEAPSPETLARVDACWSATLGLNHLDIMRSAAFQTRHLGLALKSGDRARAVRGLSTELVYRVAEGAALDSPRIQRFTAQAGMLAEQSGDGSARGFYVLCLAAAEVFAGRWREAIATARRAHALLIENQGDGTWEAWNCLMYRTWAATHLGEFDGLEDELLPSIEAAEARGDRSARAALTSGRSNLVWLIAGRSDEAAARARDAITAFPAAPFQTPHYFDLFAQTNLALAERDGVRAWSLMSEGWNSLRKIFFLRMRYFRIEARWLRGRAALAAAAHVDHPRTREARADLGRQIRALRREGQPYATAYAALLESGRERLDRAGERERALAAEASRLFASSGQSHLSTLSSALAAASSPSVVPGHRIFVPWD